MPALSTDTPKSPKAARRVSEAASRFAQRFSPRLRIVNLSSLAATIILTFLTIATLREVVKTQLHLNDVNVAYQSCQQAVVELSNTSDYLTNSTREFVTTGNPVYRDNYIQEVRTNDRRGTALSTLRTQAHSDEAITELEAARDASNQLTKTEFYAMRLAADAHGITHGADPVSNIELTAEDDKLTPDEKQIRAEELVFGTEYTKMKFIIRDHVSNCQELLVADLKEDINRSAEHLNYLLRIIYACVVLMMLVVLFVVASASVLLFIPMSHYERSIREGDPLEPSGARELRYLTYAYNEMYELNHSRTESLSFQANNDALTGVLNRGSFDSLLTLHKANSALLLIDVDLFKHFNDDYGHDMGDAILIEVSATLYSSFRSSDYVCRIGGDEFAVIATCVDASLHKTIAQKVSDVAEFLRDTSNGLPPVTISVGVAFGSPRHTDESLFHEADAALYEAKRRGRNCCVFWDELATK